jgi:1,2-diacylglycerol 3-alpha-glucosyltransferase
MVSSWPPRLCGIGTFAEEAMEFIQAHDPSRPTYVISHTDGEGENVLPIMDLSRPDWYKPVVEQIRELDPYVVHIQHEYGLYNYIDKQGVSDSNAGFLKMLRELSDYPTIVEPHTIHGRMKDEEEVFVKNLAGLCTVLLFKCEYQKWRLDWNFSAHGWALPRNIMIVPHGARSDKRWGAHEIDALKEELGLGDLIGHQMVGLVGWIQNNKRWDIVTEMWEELHERILEATGDSWLLFAAGEWRDPNHKKDYDQYVSQIKRLERAKKARFFPFIPRGDIYYKVMAICDFVILPSIDETQSGTLARIIALNKPYITTSPMEGLSSQTVSSEGGLQFTDKATLRRAVMRLATSEKTRWKLGENLKRYLDNVVGWEVVARQYYEAYEMANEAKAGRLSIDIPPEF